MLHNFGGNIEMYGTMDSVASGPIDARTSENSTMVSEIPPYVHLKARSHVHLKLSCELFFTPLFYQNVYWTPF